MKRHLRCLPLALCFFAALVACGVKSARAEDFKLADKDTLAQLTMLRDAFVKQTVTEGFSCPIKPPEILIQPTPSYGNYDDDENTLKTPAWHQLSEQERGLFHQLSGPGSTEEQARQSFESGVHRWVFIHEMGHWWQACKHANTGRKPYQIEYEANRIDAAYWRQTDPAFLASMNANFNGMFKNFPNPVPEGGDAESYFNENYGEKLAKTNAYPWFQARMIVDVDAERPYPTFAKALAQTGTALH